MALPSLNTAPDHAGPILARPTPEACALCAAFDAEATVATYAAGQEICRQGEPGYRAYRVRSGALASYRLFSDGRRQVMSFHLPGDYLGLEAGVEYSSTAVCLTEAVVEGMRRSELADLAASEASLARALWQVSVRAFHRSEEHALVLARHGAVERVVAFLVDFASRARAGDAFDLPMTRQDMADYLGLTIHTVSRTLSQLEADGLVEARASRQVRLLRPDRLREILQ